MKASQIILAAAAVLATTACNAENGRNSATTSEDSGTEVAVKPPANGDWTTIVTATNAGGFRMGNPNAKAKLIEFGSMTCPHCQRFDELGVQPLIDNYVKSGKVSYEFRNYVRDPFDITASLIARCNGAKSFFPLTRALYKDQQAWVEKIQQAPQAQMEALQNLGPDKQFVQIAQIADLQKWAAMRGVPSAKSAQCLTNQEEVNKLVQMNSDTTAKYPDFKGTPTFILNGEMVDLGPVTEAETWPALENRLKQAIGG
jgi:protein-disulfide isomerase